MSAIDVEAALAAAKQARLPATVAPVAETNLDVETQQAAEQNELTALESLDVGRELLALEATVASLLTIRADVQAKGASRSAALALESLDPGSLPERCPPNGFTVLPSPTNQAVTLESVLESIKRTFKKGLEAAVAFIKRCWNWLMDFLRRTFGADKALPEAVAQVTTASEAAVEASEFVAAQTAAKVHLDASAVSKLYKDLILEPLYGRLTQPVVAALDPTEMPKLCNDSLEMVKALIKMTSFDAAPTNLFSRAINEIDNAEGRVDKFLVRAREHGPVALDPNTGILMFGQVCAPLFRMIDQYGGAVVDRNFLLKSNPYGMLSTLSDPCVVDPATYTETCETSGKFLAARLTKTLDESVMTRRLLSTTALLKEETYRNKTLLSEIFVRLGRSLDGFRYAASPEARVKDLNRHIERLTEKLTVPDDTSLDIQVYVNTVMTGMRWLQSDVMMITKAVTMIRRVQADLMFVLKTIERGQRAVIQAMSNALRDEPELQQELRQLLERHREAHAAARTSRLGR